MRNDRHWILSPLTAAALTMIMALPVASVLTNTASAHDGRFYVGVQVPLERVDASYDKTVDNTHPDNMTPRRGMVFHDRDSDDTFAYGIGFLTESLCTPRTGFTSAARSTSRFTAARRRDNFGGLATQRGASSPAKAGRTAGPLKKTGATASRSSWAAAPGCYGHGTRASTSSEASASSRRSLRTTIEAARLM